MGICKRCQNSPPRITGIRSWAVFGNIIRDAIHQLKYKRNVALGDTFSPYLSEVILQAEWKIDVITPVPLGVARIKERGYNQASLLARPVAGRLGIPYDPKIIMRTRETKSQTKLNYQERKSNVAGAFQSNYQLISKKNVLIIDDVTTSGSTLVSCAESLFDAGANNVFGLTLARVDFHQ
jgi:competence protein ComFC